MPIGAPERGFSQRRPCLRPSLLAPKVHLWGVRVSQGRRGLVASPAAPDSNRASATHARSRVHKYIRAGFASGLEPATAASAFQFRAYYSLGISNWGPRAPPPHKKKPTILDPGPYPPRPMAPSPAKGLEEGASEDFSPPIQPPTRFPAPGSPHPPSIPPCRLLFTASDLRLSRCSVRPKRSERSGGHQKAKQ